MKKSVKYQIFDAVLLSFVMIVLSDYCPFSNTIIYYLVSVSIIGQGIAEPNNANRSLIINDNVIKRTILNSFFTKENQSAIKKTLRKV